MYDLEKCNKSIIFSKKDLKLKLFNNLIRNIPDLPFKKVEIAKYLNVNYNLLVSWLDGKSSPDFEVINRIFSILVDKKINDFYSVLRLESDNIFTILYQSKSFIDVKDNIESNYQDYSMLHIKKKLFLCMTYPIGNNIQISSEICFDIENFDKFMINKNISAYNIGFRKFTALVARIQGYP